MPDSGLRDALTLARVLSLEEGSDIDEFVGESAPMPTGQVYGGQLVAQAIVAAERTVGPQRVLHSMHGSFIRPASTSQPVDYRVTRLSEGRSYAVRRVDASQGRILFTSTVSFQVPEHSPVHGLHLGATVPEPESLAPLGERFADADDPTGRFWATEQTFDLRMFDPLVMEIDGTRGVHRGLWFRVRRELSDDPREHRAAIAYASDFGLIHVTLSPHGRAATDPGLRMASLDHAMWWHAPARADRWLLFVQSAISSRSARGLALGRIYSPDGSLVATCVQEGVIRHPADSGV